VAGVDKAAAPNAVQRARCRDGARQNVMLFARRGRRWKYTVRIDGGEDKEYAPPMLRCPGYADVQMIAQGWTRRWTTRWRLRRSSSRGRNCDWRACALRGAGGGDGAVSSRNGPNLIGISIENAEMGNRMFDVVNKDSVT